MTIDFKQLKNIYFMGIGGTGMGALAGLCKDAGYHVTGSDEALYPPMSTMLQGLGISVATPYAKENLEVPCDIIVVANCLSRGNAEIEYMMANDLPHTSFPKLVGELFLRDRTSIVVAGTHGKTTTTSLISHVLNELGEDPSFLIGGVPNNFNRSFRLGQGAAFVIEGDEYDTAFFDKGSKFLHYFPKYLVLNNLEFDHADIFQNLAMIERQFEKLIALMANPKNIIANIDNPGISNLLARLQLLSRVTKVSARQDAKEADVRIVAATAEGGAKKGLMGSKVTIEFSARERLTFVTPLTGGYNIANIANTLGCIHAMQEDGAIAGDISNRDLAAALASFKGVKRRLEHLGEWQGITVFEDFAHHPTAVGLVLSNLKKQVRSGNGGRLIAAFEPKNATSRRNLFTEEYAQALALADAVFIGKCPKDMRISIENRMDTDILAAQIGEFAYAFDDNDRLLMELIRNINKNDTIVFMSSGSFSGIQHQLLNKLKEKFPY